MSLGIINYHSLLLLLLLLLLPLPLVLGSVAGFPSELIRKYESYRNLMGLPERAITPISRPLLTQDDINRGNAGMYPCFECNSTHYPNV
jgi:hypothetical protein